MYVYNFTESDNRLTYLGILSDLLGLFDWPYYFTTSNYRLLYWPIKLGLYTKLPLLLGPTTPTVIVVNIFMTTERIKRLRLVVSRPRTRRLATYDLRR